MVLATGSHAAGLGIDGLPQVYAYPTLMEALKEAADQFQFATLDALPSELWTYAQHRFRRPGVGRPDDADASP